jgi:2-methylcitrate dehydratase PrpD
MATRLAIWLASLSLQDISATVQHGAKRDIEDALGLIVASVPEDYCQQIRHVWDASGPCSVPGMDQGFDMAGAALINGLAIHGEDFDDTLEGSPIRVGAMAIPAAFAVAERYGLSGQRTLLGVIAGLETVCRLNLVAPGAIHKAGFHPVGVIGALGASAAASVTLGLNAQQTTHALGIAGSLASGILEYLTDGAWTKRLHPGWAAQSGVKAALLASGGFNGPATVLEGPKGFFNGFAPNAGELDFASMFKDLGERWHLQDIAFKPYACGTMIHPFIDCAIQMAQAGIQDDQVVDIVCDTGAGLVDRLWEPLASKHRPSSAYAAKFSMPYCMAVAYLDRDAGLAQFTPARIRDERLLTLARKISYRIDPDNEYPRNYSGHMRVRLKNGHEHVFRQPHFRGGTKEPLTDEALEHKFLQNCRYGGWSEQQALSLRSWARQLEDQAVFSMAGFRSASSR